VDKEAKKIYLGLGRMTSEICEIFDVKTYNAWTRRIE
jgi:hypothetical protein